VRRKLFANFGHYDGQVALVTVTAPGQDVLGWDRSRCQHPGDETCSGSKGCVVDADALKLWNRTAPRRWRELHRKASQWVRRHHPDAYLMLGRVWEEQKRGALHVHVVVGYDMGLVRTAAIAYRDQLERLAPEHGFGYVGQKLSSARGENAAAYVSSYFIAGSGRKATVRETVRSIHAPGHIVHVSTRLTRATGVTMRSLRRQRYLHVIACQVERGDLVPDENGELMPADRVRAPLRL